MFKTYDTEDRFDTGFYKWGAYRISQDLGPGRFAIVYGGHGLQENRALQDSNYAAIERILRRSKVRWTTVGGQHDTVHYCVKTHDKNGKRLLGYLVAEDIYHLTEESYTLDEDLYCKLVQEYSEANGVEGVKYYFHNVEGFVTPKALWDWVVNTGVQLLSRTDQERWNDDLEHTQFPSGDMIRKMLESGGWVFNEDEFIWEKQNDC